MFSYSMLLLCVGGGGSICPSSPEYPELIGMPMHIVDGQGHMRMPILRM